MPPIVSIIGKSNSGKTTLIEKLIPELGRLGYRVGTIKHHHRGNFEIDIKGKDSWRHKQAGAFTVAISSPSGVGIHKNREKECSVADLESRYFSDCDIILTEGYKQASFPKIEIFRKKVHSSSLTEEGLSVDAMVTDSPTDMEIPFFSFDQIELLASFLEKKYIADQQVQQDIILCVNGKSIDLNSFASSFLANSITGMITSLRGCEKPHAIELFIKIPDKVKSE